MEKEDLKRKSIQLFLDGHNYTEIAKLTGYSRQYISNLIKDDERVKEKLNKRIVKVYKYKNVTKATIPIGVDFLREIGIDSKSNNDDYVEIQLNKKDKTITIKKLIM